MRPLYIALALVAASDRREVRAVAGVPWHREGYLTVALPGRAVVTADYGDGTWRQLDVDAGGAFLLRHTYHTPGDYRVTVTAFDANGWQTRGGFAVRVEAARPLVAMGGARR